jgi:preprotein translocase subunit SecA
LRAEGRPVLVGTRSVEDSEQVSELLTEARLPHQVLSARQDKGEADIVARAGKKGCITVATNMAGRGTDIPLGRGVRDNGGLHVIATQRNEAGRIDRQLFGRCGRQGDPGSYEMLLSFEDELVTDFYGPEGARGLSRILAWPIPPFPLLTQAAMRLPQWAMEQRHRRMRKVFQQTDDQLETLLAFSGRREKSL